MYVHTCYHTHNHQFSFSVLQYLLTEWKDVNVLVFPGVNLSSQLFQQLHHLVGAWCHTSTYIAIIINNAHQNTARVDSLEDPKLSLYLAQYVVSCWTLWLFIVSCTELSPNLQKEAWSRTTPTSRDHTHTHLSAMDCCSLIPCENSTTNTTISLPRWRLEGSIRNRAFCTGTSTTTLYLPHACDMCDGACNMCDRACPCMLHVSQHVSQHVYAWACNICMSWWGLTCYPLVLDYHSLNPLIPSIKYHHKNMIILFK